MTVITALETFAAAAGSAPASALRGFKNHTQQEIMLLYDPDVISAEHDPAGRDRTASSGARCAALRHGVPDRPRHRRGGGRRHLLQTAARGRAGPRRLAPVRLIGCAT
jgi:hypothetical protein